jgi:hypothetical protein
MASVVLAASSSNRAANSGSGWPVPLAMLRRSGVMRLANNTMGGVAQNNFTATFDLATATLSVGVVKRRAP